MANVFARELSDGLARLVKAIDVKVEENGKVQENKDKQLAAFVVLLSDDAENAEKSLTEFAEKHGIKNVPLTLFKGADGPEDYKIAKDANITIHLWVDQKVTAKHVLGNGRVNRKAIAPVMDDLGKILE